MTATTASVVTGPRRSGAVKAMQSVAGKYGVTLDVQYVTETVTSATVQVAKLQSDHVGMIFVATPGKPAAVSADAYKTQGLSMPLVMTDANATNSFLKSVAGTDLQMLYAASALSIAPGSVPASYPGAQKLASVFAAYKAKTGQVMDAGPHQSYIVAQIVGDVLQGAGYDASLPALENFANTHDLQTDLGPVNFRDPVSNVERGISPALVQMTPDKASWTLCQSSDTLKC